MTCSRLPSGTGLISAIDSLGNLSVLPPEVRIIVWEHFLPRNSCMDQERENWKPYICPDQPEKRSSLAILRASRLIYEEISHMLYNRCLTLQIDPHNTRWVTKHFTANAWHFRHVDFARFKRVEIEIFAPDRRDPGQLLLTRQLIFDLLCCLSGHNQVLDAKFEGYRSFAHQALLNAPSSENNLKRLTELDIVVVQDGEASWNHENLTQKSSDVVLVSDLEVLLDMFRFVRAHSSKVFLPAKLQASDDLRICIEEVEITMMLGCAFGAHEYDARTKVEEGYRSLSLDEELDTLLGPSAARLRRDRFQFWMMYEPKIKSLMNWSQFTNSTRLIWSYALRIRYHAYESWNPSSEKLRYDDDICLDSWHRKYPYGIPPTGSDEWEEHMICFGLDYDLIDDFEDEIDNDHLTALRL